MSGPKVVRIITREELEAGGRQNLVQFDLAATDYRRKAKRYDLLSQSMEMDIKKRHDRLVSLFESQQWDALQREASINTSYIKTESNLLHTKYVSIAEKARSRRRHCADSARGIILMLEQTQKNIPEQLHTIVAHALKASDEVLAEMETQLHTFFELTVARKSVEQNEDQLALANRLGTGLQNLSFAEWSIQQKKLASTHEKHLDHLLAELQVNECDEMVELFLERISRFSDEPSKNKRDLLTESLVLDVAEAVRELREQQKQKALLREMQGAVQSFNSTKSKLLNEEIERALAESDLNRIGAVLHECQSFLDSEKLQMTATARRRAILEGLATLGYEVREGMITSWVNNGKLIVHKPTAPDYGVELATTPEVSRLQIRLVGNDLPKMARTPQRDLDQETIWCGEFSRLQQIVSKGSGQLIIEQAMGVGSVPVKTVHLDILTETDREVASPVEGTTKY